VLLELRPDGTTFPVAEGAFLDMGMQPGQWTVDGSFPNERFRASAVLANGYERGDNALPPETELFMAIPVFNDQFSSREGTLTVLQRRWVFREERRIVGVFSVAPWESEDGLLPTARTYNDLRNVE